MGDTNRLPNPGSRLIYNHINTPTWRRGAFFSFYSSPLKEAKSFQNMIGQKSLEQKLVRNIQVAAGSYTVLGLALNVSYIYLSIHEGSKIGIFCFCTSEIKHINKLEVPFPDLPEEMRGALTSFLRPRAKSVTHSSLPEYFRY